MSVLFWLFFILNYEGMVWSLRLIELHVEKHTTRGSNTLMECRFDTEGEVLYAVKWYKDGNEFYRYLPSDNPQVQIFPVPGVHVDEERSGEDRVMLKSLEVSSSGTYRCEVSGEAPTFNTVTDHADMVTFVLPKEEPTITGTKLRYQIGEEVDINCTSGKSIPATTLQWYINDDQANNSNLRGPYRRFIGREGLEVTILGLNFKTKPEHFKGGSMRLKCLATIAKIYWKTNEKKVVGERQYRPPIVEKIRTNSLELDDESRADKVQASSLCNRNSSFDFVTITLVFLFTYILK